MTALLRLVSMFGLPFLAGFFCRLAFTAQTKEQVTGAIGMTVLVLLIWAGMTYWSYRSYRSQGGDSIVNRDDW